MTRSDPITGARLADRIAAHLADPVRVSARHQMPSWWRQSLAGGALGITLLHVERARTGDGSWDRAEAWLRYAAAGPLDTGPGSHLHYGLPALAYVLHHAAHTRPARYARVRAQLDDHVAAITSARADQAHRRIGSLGTAALAEFDAIRGLTGLGAYWLARDPHSPPLRAVLTYLVQLTEPHPDGRPGWWTHLGPDGRRSAEFPNGHSNHGLAHGIAGPLALLALAHRRHVRVPYHTAAIKRVLAWLDHHQHGDGVDRNDGRMPWWPYWITTDATTTSGRGRPSWCYGSAGIARAQQLAGIALDDDARVRRAETVLHSVIVNRDLLHQLDNAALCHGSTGTLAIAHVAARDSPHSRLSDAVTDLRQRVEADPRVLQAADAGHPPDLLNGSAGIALALGARHLDTHAALNDDPAPGWDSCLLIS